MAHTPGPWKWQGEDYRGDWGWQMLVGPNGEGLIIGQASDGGPSEHCRGYMPAEPAVCITGMAADGKSHAEPVHVFGEANARLIAAAPDLLEALVDARNQLGEYEEELSGELYNSPRINAAIAKAKGETP